MNRDQFIEFVKSPDLLDSGTTPFLEKLVREYPYCQTAEILYALNLNKENNFKFNSQLKTAAAYAADRRLLKQLIKIQKPSRVDAKEPIPVREPEEIIPDRIQATTPPDDKKQKAKELILLIDQLKSEVNAILTDEESVEDPELLNLASKLEGVINEHQQPPETLKPDIKDYNFSHLDEMELPGNKLQANIDLIDKFIEEEPRIEAPAKAEFFNPVDFAKHGLEDKQDIVSETLAKVYLQQGDLEKATKIYQRLSLVYPEKSSFFAAQIEKIKRIKRTDLK